jgi:hypothetical protein
MYLISKYIDKLILDLPPPPQHPIHIDLVMDGGAFNGSYLLGCLHFLKRMEKLNYIIIKRISGCCISSFMGLIYLIDALDTSNYYKTIYNHFTKHTNFNFILKILQLKYVLM